MANYAVSANSLFMKYGDKTALNDFSLTVEQGDIHVLAGPSKSGKTTFLNILAGIITPTNGTGKIFNKNIGSLEAKKIIGYVPAKPAFYSSMTLADYLVYMGMLSGISQLEAISRAVALLKKVELNSFKDKKPRDLAPGMQTKVAIAQGLMSKPRLLLLDEPVSGLDPIGKMGILQLLKELSLNEEITVIVSSSLWSDIESIADKITLLNQGRVLLSDQTPVIRNLYNHGIFFLDTSDNSMLLTVLKRMGYLRQIIRTEKGSIIIVTKEIGRFRKDLPGIIYKLEIELFTFRYEDITLENISHYLLT
jgi:ABC-2 type transport system ATP-binding protein